MHWYAICKIQQLFCGELRDKFEKDFKGKQRRRSEFAV